MKNIISSIITKLKNLNKENKCNTLNESDEEKLERSYEEYSNVFEKINKNVIVITLNDKSFVGEIKNKDRCNLEVTLINAREITQFCCVNSIYKLALKGLVVKDYGKFKFSDEIPEVKLENYVEIFYVTKRVINSINESLK